MQKGYIYIMTNPSFPDYVKIGYADNVENRLRQLNRSECIPFAFRVYATYKVTSRLTDLSLHRLIDKLNPSLRAIDTFNGKPRKKEFYAMSKEDAYSLLQAIAEINDQIENLKLYPETAEDHAAADTAELIDIESNSRKKTRPITIEEYLNTKNQDLVDIYKKLQSEVQQIIGDIEIYVLPQHIGWKVNGKYFAEIHLQKNQIRMITLQPNQEYEIGEKVPDNYLWTLNYRAYIRTMDDVEDAQKILIDSYNKRK